MNPAFWKGKRVFMTGHTGFKGSWLSLWLQHLGAEVTGYSLTPPTQPNLFESADVARGMTSLLGDIRDLPALQSAMRGAKPEIVIHMAAQPLVRLSYDEPVETYTTNVIGTVHVLEAVRHTAGVRAVVNITTDKCYENKEWEWGYREDEPMGGFDPYSSSKGCAELVTSAYRSSYFNSETYAKHGVAIASARAGNVIGGGDWAKDRLIPDILQAFEKAQAVMIRNPQATRPWQHVLEPLRGYLMLAERLYNDGPAFEGGWNFGPHSSDVKPVEWIVREMAKRWTAGASWEVDSSAQPHEANYLKLDISKAGRYLQWQPAIQLHDAIGLIVDWAKARLEGADLRALTLSQIQAYQSSCLTNNHPD
ncbi:CDP-glucose 4,6-dehydratase [Herbaspirillum seropedicae]|uniref:CDP-glucose 4,6-dehydratase n=1 Tax=Herbaspirillum seropedicae TaxID=964 RepID=UPI0011203D14|nr:CDP-glucose 4,6-dehydratase [Herbaspirillum seropedicae]QDD66441.1 CDP-glucose 4,6-dehydratase [Herbaspirillum seropedicae]